MHPQLGLLCGAALLPAFFYRKTAHVMKKKCFPRFPNDFSLKWTWFAIKSRNHYRNRHPDPYRILVGTLNPWNGRPRVVPWPILFERVVSKPQNSRPYLLVCIKRTPKRTWNIIMCFITHETVSIQYLSRVTWILDAVPAADFKSYVSVIRMYLCLWCLVTF